MANPKVNKESSKIRLLAMIGLLVVIWMATIWFFYYLTGPETRSETFIFTVGFVCFLEFLIIGDFAILFIPKFRKGIVWALYPIVSIIVGLYVVVSVGIVTGYNFFHIIIGSPTAYFIALSIESVIFLTVLGFIIMLNAYKKGEDTTIQREATQLTKLSVRVQEIYQDFVSRRGLLDIQTYRDIESDLRKLKEKFQFCTPFGRLEIKASDVAKTPLITGYQQKLGKWQEEGYDVSEFKRKWFDTIEEEILDQIASLGKLVGEISSGSEAELGKKIENIKHLIATTLQAMERRERLLIK